MSESAHLKLITLETDQCVKQCTSLPEKNWCTGRPAKKTVVAVRKGRIPQPSTRKFKIRKICSRTNVNPKLNWSTVVHIDEKEMENLKKMSEHTSG